MQSWINDEPFLFEGKEALDFFKENKCGGYDVGVIMRHVEISTNMPLSLATFKSLYPKIIAHSRGYQIEGWHIDRALSEKTKAQ